MFQLIFTSTPKGLIDGRAGFSTVAMTHGFPKNLIPIIENLSAYERLFQQEDPNADRNPVNYRFIRQKIGTQTYGILSKIEFSGPGYSRRGTPIASHLLFSPQEMALPDFRPAHILAIPENFRWSGQVEELPVDHRIVMEQPAPIATCPTWERLFGNAEWAKAAAWQFKTDKTKPLFIAFDPLQNTSEDLLMLVKEICLWLTPEEIAEFTFSTYCHQSSFNSFAFLRAYPIGSPYLGSIRRFYADAMLTTGTNPALSAAYLDSRQTDKVPQQEILMETERPAPPEPSVIHAPTNAQIPAPPSDTQKVTEKNDSAPKTEEAPASLPQSTLPPPSVVPFPPPPSVEQNENTASDASVRKLKLFIVLCSALLFLLLIISISLLLHTARRKNHKATPTEVMPAVSEPISNKTPKPSPSPPKLPASAPPSQPPRKPPAVPAHQPPKATDTAPVSQKGTKSTSQPSTKEKTPKAVNSSQERTAAITAPPKKLSLQEEMDLFVDGKSQHLPNGWKDLVQNPKNYGVLKLELNKSEILVSYTPSKYVIKCVEKKRIRNISIQKGDECQEFSPNPGFSEIKYKWNAKGMTFIFPMEEIRKKFDALKSSTKNWETLSQKRSDEVEKYKELEAKGCKDTSTVFKKILAEYEKYLKAYNNFCKAKNFSGLFNATARFQNCCKENEDYLEATNWSSLEEYLDRSQRKSRKKCRCHLCTLKESGPLDNPDEVSRALHAMLKENFPKKYSSEKSKLDLSSFDALIKQLFSPDDPVLLTITPK